MDLPESVVIIRNYRPGDEDQCRKIIHGATMSTVNAAFRATLTREVSLQLIVAISAIMFIFVGLTPSWCLLSLPSSALIIYLAVYIVHFVKSKTMDDMSSIPKTYMSSINTGFWVAELLTLASGKEQIPRSVRIISESEALHLRSEGYHRRIVGTAAVINSSNEWTAAWMRRMAVVPTYQHKGIASALVDQVIAFCQERGYENIELVTSEYHSAARELYAKKGFQLRQLYHKQIFANVVQVLMYEFIYNLK